MKRIGIRCNALNFNLVLLVAITAFDLERIRIGSRIEEVVDLLIVLDGNKFPWEKIIIAIYSLTEDQNIYSSVIFSRIKTNKKNGINPTSIYDRKSLRATLSHKSQSTKLKSARAPLFRLSLSFLISPSPSHSITFFRAAYECITSITCRQIARAKVDYS